MVRNIRMRNGECFRWKFVTTARPVYSMKIRNFFERMKKKIERNK